jgi:hypothetical protein
MQLRELIASVITILTLDMYGISLNLEFRKELSPLIKLSSKGVSSKGVFII